MRAGLSPSLFNFLHGTSEEARQDLIRQAREGHSSHQESFDDTDHQLVDNNIVAAEDGKRSDFRVLKIEPTDGYELGGAAAVSTPVPSYPLTPAAAAENKATKDDLKSKLRNLAKTK